MCDALSLQGPHGTGKIVKVIPYQEKHREFGNFAKTRGNHMEFGCKVVNPLILKVRDIWIFAHKFLKSWICLPSQFGVCSSHKSRKLAQGKFAVKQGKNSENTGNL